MRITQGMMTNNILQNMSMGYGKLADYQNQLATGKKITRPSQDPVVASMGIAYRTDVNHITQYQKNVTTADKWLQSSDSALSQVNDVLDTIRELTNQASNDTYTPAQRQTIGDQISQLTQQLVTIGNTQIGGQYIFSGEDSQNPLLTEDSTGAVSINSTALANPSLSVNVNDGVSMPINVNPNQVFTSSLFSDLSDLKNALNDPSSTGEQIDGFLDKIDTHLNDVANAQADVGAKQNRVDTISSQLDAQNTMATQIMATNEDADYASVIVNLNQQQNVYNASLAVGARIIQQSLVDFLK
ncbi:MULTISPECIES: flagellar hook-associated protein FlgL [unclassified Sporolactobacillus]|uniref:flagellar hook-associated protein FlgL n=1 Tax=unclassified Sporolactobacillus TaxID=2628533 RepID=UPI0023685335|nr:flagellar hook-associated protein FlgL [Sporolactobacillus sp. CQH2019]MDD9148052.1 flagellar hook-associated protein FlgL [Sporolactobacillus sp. CQH2019]